ncbi:MAG: arginyltransferase, partial [Sphingomonadaceae bacterium]
ILDHIRRAAEAGLPYVYLGYWIDGSDRMAYKGNFRPIEKLTPAGWQEFEPTPRVPERRAQTREPVFG